MIVTDSISMSEIGMRHAVNNDSVLMDAELGIFAVADGVGGRPGGEIASRLAVDHLRDSLAPIAPPRRLEPSVLEAAMQKAHQMIVQVSNDGDAVKGMATTLSALCLGSHSAAIAHVGDSRIRLCRDRHIQLLTEDHGLVAELVRGGHIPSEKAQQHPLRHVLTQALGAEKPLHPHIAPLRLAPGDLFLLSSDGLDGVIDEGALESLLTRHTQSSTPVYEICEDIRAAIKGQALMDDLTVALVRILEISGEGTCEMEESHE